MIPPCAICGWREPSAITEWDGRKFPACSTCTSPPDVPAEWSYEPTADVQAPCVEYGRPSRASILAAIAEVGEATAGDIAKRLGVPKGTRGYSSVTTFLMRMRRAGEVVARQSSDAGGHQGALVYSEGSARVRSYLPQRPRGEVVELFKQGKRAKEIARELGMRMPAVRTAICNARKRGEIQEAA